MSDATAIKGGLTRELVLEGELLTQRVAEVKKELQKALNEVDTLMINLVRTSEMDLSFLQLLCSAHRTSVALDKTMIRMGGPEVKGVFKGIDMTDSQGCSFAGNQECVWTGG